MVPKTLQLAELWKRTPCYVLIWQPTSTLRNVQPRRRGSLVNKIRLSVLHECDQIQTKNISQSKNRHIIWPAIAISAITVLLCYICRNLPFILVSLLLNTLRSIPRSYPNQSYISASVTQLTTQWQIPSPIHIIYNGVSELSKVQVKVLLRFRCPARPKSVEIYLNSLHWNRKNKTNLFKFYQNDNQSFKLCIKKYMDKNEPWKLISPSPSRSASLIIVWSSSGLNLSPGEFQKHLIRSDARKKKGWNADLNFPWPAPAPRC